MKKLKNLTRASMTFVVNGENITLPPNYMKGKDQSDAGVISLGKDIYKSLAEQPLFKKAVEDGRILAN